MSDTAAVQDAEAFLFDVFGTVVDWQGSVSKQLEEYHEGLLELDWVTFAKEWRKGYIENTRRIAQGGSGSTNIDIIHREILDAMLASPKWQHLAAMWDDSKRTEINLVWHKLKGWPDASAGLYALKQQGIIGTLSNGNVKLLVDMAKYADLPWDVIFSGELLGSYKPDPKVYLGAIHHLSLPPSKCVLVAAHIYDLRAAASHGIKTVYVRRATEDADERDQVRSKADGGEVDLVVDSLLELAKVLREGAISG